jgi:hypothetical protein
MRAPCNQTALFLRLFLRLLPSPLPASSACAAPGARRRPTGRGPRPNGGSCSTRRPCSCAYRSGDILKLTKTAIRSGKGWRRTNKTGQDSRSRFTRSWRSRRQRDRGAAQSSGPLNQRASSPARIGFHKSHSANRRPPRYVRISSPTGTCHRPAHQTMRTEKPCSPDAIREGGPAFRFARCGVQPNDQHRGEIS